MSSITRACNNVIYWINCFTRISTFFESTTKLFLDKQIIRTGYPSFPFIVLFVTAHNPGKLIWEVLNSKVNGTGFNGGESWHELIQTEIVVIKTITYIFKKKLNILKFKKYKTLNKIKTLNYSGIVIGCWEVLFPVTAGWLFITCELESGVELSSFIGKIRSAKLAIAFE